VTRISGRPEGSTVLQGGSVEEEEGCVGEEWRVRRADRIVQRAAGQLEVNTIDPKTDGDSSGCIEVYALCVKAVFSLLTTRGRRLWLYRSLCFCVKAVFSLLTTRGRLLWLYRSLCFCVKAVFSLLTTRGRLLWLYRSLYNDYFS